MNNGKTFKVLKTVNAKTKTLTVNKGKKGKNVMFRVVAKNGNGKSPTSKTVTVKKKK